MEGRRYSENGNIPVLDFTPIEPSDTEKIRSVRRSQYLIPNATDSIISQESRAKECFVDRHYSKKMQQFMLHYSYTLCTTNILSGEV